MKGILLAGGRGTRLAPLTWVASKQLLPVFDKPLLNYPLSTLLLAGIKDILIISTPQDLPVIERYLGDGSDYGIRLTYCVQPQPNGIAEAFLLAEDHIGTDPVTLALGDNIFFGEQFGKRLLAPAPAAEEARIYCKSVDDPRAFGVATLDDDSRPVEIIENPTDPVSSFAVTGLYSYGTGVVEVANSLAPSPRGELEITDLNMHYVRTGKIDAVVLEPETTWMDAGSPDSLLKASNFVANVYRLHNLKIGCLEETTWRMGNIDRAQLESLAVRYIREKSDYGTYLLNLLDETTNSLVNNEPS